MSEMRLIDANALLKSFDVAKMVEYDETGCGVTRLAIPVQTIKDAPTIDAVPVVRCRDCKRFWEYTELHKATIEKADGDCMIRCMVAPDDLRFCAVQKDDYCSMGKRKGAKMDGGAENA